MPPASVTTSACPMYNNVNARSTEQTLTACQRRLSTSTFSLSAFLIQRQQTTTPPALASTDCRPTDYPLAARSQAALAVLPVTGFAGFVHRRTARSNFLTGFFDWHIRAIINPA